MTREEQMWQAVEQEHGKISRREALIALTAMEWSDKTMINKACEWLKENIDGGVHPSSAYRFVEKFRKAMEE